MKWKECALKGTTVGMFKWVRQITILLRFCRIFNHCILHCHCVTVHFLCFDFLAWTTILKMTIYSLTTSDFLVLLFFFWNSLLFLPFFLFFFSLNKRKAIGMKRITSKRNKLIFLFLEMIVAIKTPKHCTTKILKQMNLINSHNKI